MTDAERLRKALADVQAQFGGMVSPDDICHAIFDEFFLGEAVEIMKKGEGTFDAIEIANRLALAILEVVGTDTLAQRSSDD